MVGVGFDNLIWPRPLENDISKESCARLFHGLSTQRCQQLLDELDGAIEVRGPLSIRNPIAYLRTLIELDHKGELILEHAGRVAQERADALERQALKAGAMATPPVLLHGNSEAALTARKRLDELRKQIAQSTPLPPQRKR